MKAIVVAQFVFLNILLKIYINEIGKTKLRAWFVRLVATKGPFGTALAREKTALALAPMEKQLFLALAYFVRKRLAKRLLLAFQNVQKMSIVHCALAYVYCLEI